MNFLHSRPKSALCLAVVLLALGFALSCQPPAQPSPSPSPSPSSQRQDPRAEFAGSLKGANVNGFIFETKEDDKQSVTSLTNSAVRDLIRMDANTNSVVLRYTTVKDKGATVGKTYKTELTKSDNALTLLVTDFNTGAVVSKDTFRDPTPHGEPKFDSLEACIADFRCKQGAALQCEANRTCKDQFAGLICCLNNGQCFSVHLVIKPTSLKCLIVGTIPDLEGIVLARP